MPSPRKTGEVGLRRRAGKPRRAVYVLSLPGLLCALCLMSCAYWTHPTKPSAAFTEDASACQRESFQASTTYDSFDVASRNAYLACLRSKGWTLQ
jgi:hypothetical protein